MFFNENLLDKIQYAFLLLLVERCHELRTCNCVLNMLRYFSLSSVCWRSSFLFSLLTLGGNSSRKKLAQCSKFSLRELVSHKHAYTCVQLHLRLRTRFQSARKRISAVQETRRKDNTLGKTFSLSYTCWNAKKVTRQCCTSGVTRKLKKTRASISLFFLAIF